MARTIVIAWLVAGTLDIISAFVFAGMAGATPTRVLQFVASGPFGDGMYESAVGASLGLLTHFAIMLAMAAAYVAIAPNFSAVLRHPIVAGLLYGLLLWVIMYWIVRPLRWPELWPPEAYTGDSVSEIAWSVGNALFSHCILVGIPIAWITARSQRV
ncbi:hypothetical protein [Pelagerythrobacter aerophilus]|uniref:DUF1440 domain-containing protein n=1 Tax=Pelagerythrobacter aerophilus TaxID=2306995 RepID=A0A418NJE1_9SPHN|nr:hypothetical protein [Pelagerythrobacter aerophilus]RIV79477.1 hypothetical protein D2V04_05685 [Pelagerythrobacter aerophilus]